MSKILIIGAGINGILTGLEFCEKGFDVTILEEDTNCGRKTTFANGCQLSFAHTTPIFIQPSFFSNTFARPFLLPKNTKKWLKLHKNSQKINDEKFHNLIKLALESSQKFESLLQKYYEKVEDIWHDFGTVYIFANRKQFNKRKKQFEIQENQYNIPFKSLIGNNIPDCDLALSGLSKNFQNAIFTPIDKALNAFQFTQIMAQEFEKLGGKIKYNITIHEILQQNDKISAIKTSNGDFTGYDFYIYAGGASGLDLIQKFCPNLHAVTGYSLTFDVSYSNHCPLVNVIDFSNKVVYSRHGDILRVAGFFDIKKPKNPQKRINDLYKTAISTFPILKRHELVHTWCENRVFSADEMPICRKFLSNFAINTAHGHLGVTLSAGMAQKMLNIFLDN